MNELRLLEEREILGKDFKIYGTPNEPLFLAKDVARWIEYDLSSVNKLVNQVNEDEKVRKNVPTLGGNQEMWFLTEDGLYEVLMQSRKPIAKQFKKKVKAILKDIRKHGAYMTDSKIEEVLLNPDTIIQLATQLKEEREKRVQSETFIHKIAASHNSILVREVAKIASKEGITIGEKRLWNKLRDWGLIFKNSTEPMQEYVDRGYFEVVEGVKETEKKSFTYRTTRVTGKGQVYIIQRLIKEDSKRKAI